jgi:hypothetical protein
MRARLLAIKIELRRTMHDPIAEPGAWMKRMLQGHPNYFAVSGNHPTLWWFFNKVRRLWLMSLRRRSQKAHLSWLLSVNQDATPAALTASTPKARCVGTARRDLRGGGEQSSSRDRGNRFIFRPCSFASDLEIRLVCSRHRRLPGQFMWVFGADSFRPCAERPDP